MLALPNVARTLRDADDVLGHYRLDPARRVLRWQVAHRGRDTLAERKGQVDEKDAGSGRREARDVNRR
jgi:hypothetical protein